MNSKVSRRSKSLFGKDDEDDIGSTPGFSVVSGQSALNYIGQEAHLDVKDVADVLSAWQEQQAMNDDGTVDHSSRAVQEELMAS